MANEGLASSSRTADRGRSRYVVASQIVDYIRENRLEREQHLVETTLANRFAVSRTIIRAALRLLAERGIVDARRNQGFYLQKPWTELEEEMIEIPATVDEDLYRRIVSERIEGSIPDVVNQVTLEQRFGANRSAVLRVLARLTDEGIIAKNSGRGWQFLPTLSGTTGLRSSYDLRRVIEPAGILLDTFTPDPEKLERLQRQHTAVGDRKSAASPVQIYELDVEFHEVVAGFTMNVFFAQMVQQQNRLRRLLEFESYHDRRRVSKWLGEHVGILEALQNDRRELAAELMTRHLEAAYRGMKSP